MSELPTVGRQLRSLVKSSGELELSLQDVEVQPPGDKEVLVKVEASPINPSDLGLLLAMSDVSRATQSGTDDDPVVTAPILSLIHISEPTRPERISYAGFCL